eukprot:6336089-Amphidinium_carterae.2
MEKHLSALLPPSADLPFFRRGRSVGECSRCHSSCLELWTLPLWRPTMIELRIYMTFTDRRLRAF